MSEPDFVLWFGLFAVAIAAAALDIFFFRKLRAAGSRKAALVETGAWIALALLFDVWILHVKGQRASIDFLSGYLIEKSLSLDNIFIFLVIFRSFRLDPQAQHRVLFYGVGGALVLRAAFVFGGVALLNHFRPVIYIFGSILFITAIRMLRVRHNDSGEPGWVRIASRVLPVTKKDDARHFFVREDGRLLATSLFLALLTIELTDVMFAADSVPAVLSITRDTFIAYSSNVFAVLGLRAIYFVLAGVLRRGRFLRQGLAAVLCFTGLKMVLGSRMLISDEWSLAIIAAIFGITAVASISWPHPRGNSL